MSKRDSIAQCDPNKGMYDLRSTPRALDSAMVLEYETTQKLDVDKRLLTRLNNNSIWKGLGLLLKYLFMVFLVPPYLVFYGLPKWLFQKAGPSFSKIAKKIHHTLKKLNSKITHAIQKIVPTTQGTKRVLQWDKIKQGVYTLYTRLQNVCQICINKLKSTSNTCRTFLNRILVTLKNYSLKEKCQHLLKRFLECCFALINAPKTILVSSANKIRALILSIKVSLTKMGAALSTQYVKCQDQIKGLYLKLKAPLKRLIESILRQFDAAKVKLKSLSVTVFTPIKALLDKVQKIKGRCKNKLMTWCGAIKKFWNKVIAPIELRIQSVFQLFSRYSGTLNTVTHRVKAILTKIQGFLTTVNTYARRLNWATVCSTSKQVADKLLTFFKTTGAKIAQTWNQLNLARKLFPRWVRDTCSKYAKKGIYAGQVFFALLRIFPKYILKIIEDLFGELKQRFP